MGSILLKKMFEMQRWEQLIDKAVDKGINKNVLRELSKPQQRLRLYEAIKTGNYEIAPPHIARIPKDNGDFREVYVNEDVDRIVLSLVNDILFELYGHKIHPNCKSYQKGKSCGQTVQLIASTIGNMKTKGEIGSKSDLSKYFDSVPIQFIDRVFDELQAENDLQDCPVFKFVRHYYHNNLVFDVEGNLIEHYGSLKQGCAVASFLADYILRDIDETISNMDVVYCRYSDDIVIVGNEHKKAMETLKKMLTDKGLVLNPKKVEPLYADKWFTFLGFKIKGTNITFSKKRVKKFQKEIESRTIKTNRTYDAAKRSVYKFLYKAYEDKNYGWAQGTFPIVNVTADVVELDNFVKDCLRASSTKEDGVSQSK